jgi:hypothetical protein
LGEAEMTSPCYANAVYNILIRGPTAATIMLECS